MVKLIVVESVLSVVMSYRVLYKRSILSVSLKFTTGFTTGTGFVEKQFRGNKHFAPVS